MNIKEILTNKKKEFITGCVVGTVLIVCGGMVVYGAGDTSPKLKLKRDSSILNMVKDLMPILTH